MPAKLIENFNASEWTSYVREGSQRWKNNKTGEAAIQQDNVQMSAYNPDDTKSVYIGSCYFFPTVTETTATGDDVGLLDPFGWVDKKTANKIAGIVSDYNGGGVTLFEAPAKDNVTFSAPEYKLTISYKDVLHEVSCSLIAQQFLGGISYANGVIRELTKPTLDGMFSDW